ncbi:50S ribosome-binding protein YggL [Pseudomonas sp. J452]|uniref:YggL 50S ribosome-binding family protein n=1 Tax=Pseudomonas sp. J452 TaxID=2898441 RepID=UPI0021AD5993|nr:50S ribosome-binding protein YggL [Pseudomonas sp. J452]UUY07129.1 50S ribosome-binding protein YggL [Pseudomonas sp. J452]
MATNRSRRLRKKLCVDEFQELGCELTLSFRDGLSDAEMDSFVEAFLGDAVESNGLGYVGGDDYGFVCLAERGSVSAEQRDKLEAWLKGRSDLTGFTLSPLMDVWYPENSVNPA